MPRLRILLILALIVGAFIAGYKLRPRLNAEVLYTAYAKYVGGLPSHKEQPEDGVLEHVMDTDYASLIDLPDTRVIDARRKAMAEYLFRGEPTGMNRRPDHVERDILFPPLADLKVAGIDLLTVNMPWDVDSKIYFLRAATPRSCLMIYQEGHRVSFLEHKRFLRRMLGEGCDVLALSMPLTGGMNSRPLIDHPRLGRILLNDPDDLQLLNTARHSSLSYFIMPLIAALNHALDQRPYDRIGATGFSGGGWSVQIFAALDPRVQTTYSVAGSVPAAVHAAMPAWGSPEQRHGAFYDIVNYPELYVMAADRPGRAHVQVYNETDPCCFSGRNWLAWKDAIGDKIRALGGRYRLFTYENPQHTLPKPVALTIVDDFLNGGRATPDGVIER